LVQFAVGNDYVATQRITGNKDLIVQVIARAESPLPNRGG